MIVTEQGYALSSLWDEIASDGRPFGAAFNIGYRDIDGAAVEFSAADFQMDRVTEGNKHSFCFYGNKKLSNIKIVFEVTNTEQRSICKARIIGVHPTLILEWFEPVMPVISAAATQLVLPQSEGILVRLEKINGQRCRPGWHDYIFYPGAVEAQFMAAITDTHGLYFAAHDPTHTPKYLLYRSIPDGFCQLSVRYYCGTDSTDGYELPGELVLEKFTGDWMDAADIYRNWMDNDPALPPKGVFSELVKESPVVAIYPVRGKGSDKGEMSQNEYFPYSNAAPVLEKLSEKCESKVMALMMHWEGTAPWAPPYVWPPFGGEESLAQLRDRLHAKGNYLGVYCSGYAWTQFSWIDMNYSREDQFEQGHLAKEMIRGPHGELDAYICCGWASQRDGFDMCPAQDWARNTITQEVAKIAEFGIDYAQFFDQNIGGASHFCWSREHNHPPVPGVWQTNVMQSLLENLHEKYPNLMIGCEGAAAQPYLNRLSFNDLRFDCWTLGVHRSIPLYAYLFHEYINNFMGNQCGLHTRIDFEACPENLLWRTAKAFNSGDLLSVVLKDGGKIHWGWIVPWDNIAEPDQDDIITLVGNLNALRKKYPQYLNQGRMEHPLAQISGESWILRLHNNRSEEYEAFLHSTWQSPNGERAMFITNFLPRTQTVKVTYQNKSFELQLPPLNAIILTEENLLQNI